LQYGCNLHDGDVAGTLQCNRKVLVKSDDLNDLLDRLEQISCHDNAVPLV
jgi:hypothetical protein